jgi:hypothetical protein
MAQEIASNMVSFFERVVASGSSNTGAHEHQLSSVVDSLLSSSRTCTQIGDQVWTLFEIVQRDLDRDLQPAVPQRAVRWGWREHAALGGLELARVGGRQTLPLVAGALLLLLSLAAAVLLSVLRRLFGGGGRRRQRTSKKKKQ